MTNSPTCTCGCGASTRGWSDAGKAHGHRDGVTRVYRSSHGQCHTCGQPLDQYQECSDCGPGI